MVGLTLVGLRCKQFHNVHGQGQGGIKPMHHEGVVIKMLFHQVGLQGPRQLPSRPSALSLSHIALPNTR